MVRRKRKQIWAGERFVDLRNVFKQQYGMSDVDFTNSLANFVEDERLVQHMARRAQKRHNKRRNGGFWFDP